jgi:hypothetical protein
MNTWQHPVNKLMSHDTEVVLKASIHQSPFSYSILVAFGDMIVYGLFYHAVYISELDIPS